MGKTKAKKHWRIQNQAC